MMGQTLDSLTVLKNRKSILRIIYYI